MRAGTPRGATPATSSLPALIRHSALPVSHPVSHRESILTQISISNAVVEFGATTLFRDITFTVCAGERWGIIGRNGTGKTTLFRLITGEMAATRGTVARQPGTRVSLLEQHRDFGDAASVWEAAAGPFAELLALERSLVDQA